MNHPSFDGFILITNCNAFIERWNRAAREEFLDHQIISGERYLRRLLSEHVKYFTGGVSLDEILKN